MAGVVVPEAVKVSQPEGQFGLFVTDELIEIGSAIPVLEIWMVCAAGTF
jgi:hypothetical protein